MDVTQLMPTPSPAKRGDLAARDKRGGEHGAGDAEPFNRYLEAETRGAGSKKTAASKKTVTARPEIRRDAVSRRPLHEEAARDDADAPGELLDEGLGGALALVGSTEAVELTRAAVNAALGGKVSLPAGLEALRQLTVGSLKDLLQAAMASPGEAGADDFAARLAQMLAGKAGDEGGEPTEGGEETVDPVTLTGGEPGGEALFELAGGASRATHGTSVVTEGALAGPAAPPVAIHAPATPGFGAPPAAAPAHLPPGVEEGHILRQISDGIRLNGDAAVKTAEIALDPPELGRVRLRLTMEDGAVRIVVTTEHSGVKALLAGNLDRLRQDLLAQGVQAAHVEVRQESADGRRSRGDADERVDEPRELRDDARPARPRARRLRAHAGRIDVTV